MECWLKQSRVIGLVALELANFPVIGRGVRTLQHFKVGERIQTIPSDVLWIVEHVYADSLLGPAHRSMQPPLSVDGILAMYILLV